MFEIDPKGWFSRTLIIRNAGQVICAITLARFGEKATFTLEGVKYQVYRQPSTSGMFALAMGDQQLAVAEKPASAHEMKITYGTTSYLLKRTGSLGHTCELTINGEAVGYIKPKHGTRAARAEIPEAVPLPIKIFIIWLYLLLWRRAASASASAGGADGRFS